MTQIISSSARYSTAGKFDSVWYDTRLSSYDTNNIISIQFISFFCITQIISSSARYSTAGKSVSVWYDTLRLLSYDTNNIISIQFISSFA